MDRLRLAIVATVLALGASACSGTSEAGSVREPARESAVSRPSAAPPTGPTGAVATREAVTGRTEQRRAGQRRPAAGPEPSSGRPARAHLTIPALGLHRLPVVPYRGRPDDGPGTEIQDGGVAASPHGPRGGTGAGGIGNYIVTAHRTSSTRAFEHLPALRRGERVHVDVRGTRYTYRVTRTRWTSFRSPRSLARQAAAVPGHPGRRPTRAMITLSTCATPEDHAAGNYWADEFGNPEHRIDKIGVLVDVTDR